MRTVTAFDTSRHHIYVDFGITNRTGDRFELTGVFATGAPWTELNGAILAHAGLFDGTPGDDVALEPELQTQKYARAVLPSITICGHGLVEFEVMVSRFDPTWGIAGLIGLDFFRCFKVTIDYSRAVLVCESLAGERPRS